MLSESSRLQFCQAIKGFPIIFGLFWLVVLGFGHAYAGEIYKWVDERGVVHFSDRESSVPANMKSRIEVREVGDSKIQNEVNENKKTNPRLLATTPQKGTIESEQENPACSELRSKLKKLHPLAEDIKASLRSYQEELRRNESHWRQEQRRAIDAKTRSEVRTGPSYSVGTMEWHESNIRDYERRIDFANRKLDEVERQKTAVKDQMSSNRCR